MMEESVLRRLSAVEERLDNLGSSSTPVRTHTGACGKCKNFEDPLGLCGALHLDSYGTLALLKTFRGFR